MLRGHRRADLPLDTVHQHSLPLAKQIHHRHQPKQHGVSLAIVPSKGLCTKPVQPDKSSMCLRRGGAGKKPLRKPTTMAGNTGQPNRLKANGLNRQYPGEAPGLERPRSRWQPRGAQSKRMVGENCGRRNSEIYETPTHRCCPCEFASPHPTLPNKEFSVLQTASLLNTKWRCWIPAAATTWPTNSE